jgi:hypothetical protein
MRVGLLWRYEWDPPASGAVPETCKLRGVFAAFAALGVEAEPVVYSDETAALVRAQLLALDGVLVWVNPIEQGLDRSRLDPLLLDVSAAGVWVSAHPDVIAKIATKEVLFATRHMSWGSETQIYRSAAELREHLPGQLAEHGPLVLKRHRGMGGLGVWKLEASTEGKDDILVQHAAGREPPERVALDGFLTTCEPYFAGNAPMVAQPFQPRLGEGMIRAYLTHDKVVGFTHQFPRGLMPPGADARPTGKRFEPPSEPRYSDLRSRLESDWVPELIDTVGLQPHALPVIWDADFLYGPPTSTGADTYVLCEINASSTFAFPELAMAGVAAAAVSRIQEHRKQGGAHAVPPERVL